jgi:hypothetical protein
MTCWRLNASVREHVVTVLERRGMVLAALRGGRITLLGASGDLRKLMRVVQQLDLEFSAEDLERRLPRERDLVESAVRRLLAAGLWADGEAGAFVALRQNASCNSQAELVDGRVRRRATSSKGTSRTGRHVGYNARRSSCR